jgi:hypothetical protein
MTKAVAPELGSALSGEFPNRGPSMVEDPQASHNEASSNSAGFSALGIDTSEAQRPMFVRTKPIEEQGSST